MALTVGVAHYLSRNTGTWGTPTWNEVPIVQDVEIPLEAEEGESTSRAMLGWKTFEPTLKSLSYEFDIIWDGADTDLIAIRDAFNNKTTLEVVATDGPVATAGSQGPRAVVKVFKFHRHEPINGVTTVSVVLKPCHNVANAPAWFVAV